MEPDDAVAVEAKWVTVVATAVGEAYETAVGVECEAAGVAATVEALEASVVVVAWVAAAGELAAGVEMTGGWTSPESLGRRH